MREVFSRVALYQFYIFLLLFNRYMSLLLFVVYASSVWRNSYNFSFNNLAIFLLCLGVTIVFSCMVASILRLMTKSSTSNSGGDEKRTHGGDKMMKTKFMLEEKESDCNM